MAPLTANKRELRLKRLLSHGYFPAEVPSPFTSVNFAAHAMEFADKWDHTKIKKFWTAPEDYSTPRYGHARRKLAIVNPINQLLVCDLIATNWLAIRKRLIRSNISEFDPRILPKGNRAVSGIDFDGVSRRTAEILSSYGRFVKTDIARFYGSLYTHSIARAILGKDYCKANHNTNNFKQSFGNHLDKAVSAGQRGQTIGIPIGPDSSRILSELIATEIELIAEKDIADFGHRSVRYVDDFIVGLQEAETPAVILRGLSSALYEYELEVNAEKTLTKGLGQPHSPEWVHFVRSFEPSARESRQREDLDSYFEQVIYLADANSRDNVLLFAAKRAVSFAIAEGNWTHLVRWLLYISRRSPSCLSFIAEHLAANHHAEQSISDEISKYILQQIPSKALSAHTDELAWLLFWAKNIGLNIPVDLLKHVVALRSSVVGLLVMDLNDKGQLEGKLDVSYWQSFASTDGLKSSMWLMAYEAAKKGWWPNGVETAYVSDHEFFSDVWEKDIWFYDENKKARTHTLNKFSNAFSWKPAWSLGYPF